MLGEPNPVLNEKVQALVGSAPEECLRQAVQRGVISLDQVTEDLSPHVAAAVRSIVTGERLPAPSGERSFLDLPEDLIRSFEQAREHPPTEADLEQMREFVRIQTEQTQEILAPYPRLQRLLDEQALSGAEATTAAHAIDHALGRYLTGTRYAAP
jgi:hypothetical protein